MCTRVGRCRLSDRPRWVELLTVALDEVRDREGWGVAADYPPALLREIASRLPEMRVGCLTRDRATASLDWWTVRAAHDGRLLGTVRGYEGRDADGRPSLPSRYTLQTRSGASRLRRNGAPETRATWREAVDRLAELLLVEGWTIAAPER